MTRRLTIAPRPAVVIGIAGLLVLTMGLGIARLMSGGPSTSSGSTESVSTGRSAVVTKRTLIATVEADGTLGYGQPRTVTSTGGGTITGLPEPGAVIGPDQSLYDVDGHAGPIVLIGTVPMWRTLDPATAVADGMDVEQLEAALQALGYGEGTGLTVDDHYTSATAAAVRNWQEAHGFEESGRVGPAEVYFAPAPVRVASVAAEVGAPAVGEILEVSATQRRVEVDLDAKYGQYAVESAKVTIELTDRTKIDGTITRVATAATVTQGAPDDPPKTTIGVEITPDGPVDALDESPVTVAFTTDAIEDALAVPVEAVVAAPDGGYALEVIDGSGTRLVPVELGRFSDGWVQVTGDVSAGDRVVTA